MSKPASAIDAIAPAIDHVKRVLFRPFDLGSWFILGFLLFLQILPEYLGQFGQGLRFSLDRRRDDIWETSREVAAWMSGHWPIVALFGFFGVLVILVLAVLFQWLSSRGTFCYIDCVATNRTAVVRPWGEHRELADSYFFWRLLFSICVIVLLSLIAVPIVLSIWSLAGSGEGMSAWRALFGSGVVVLMVCLAVLLFFGVLLVKTFLVDFVTPVQYLRRVRCSQAFRIVIDLAKAHPGGFVLYLVLRLLFAIVAGFGVFCLGCATCCIGFCCMAIPVIGQVLLQPLYIFNRSFPLFFLRSLGPEFDVFSPATPGGGLGSPPGSGGSSAEPPEGTSVPNQPSSSGPPVAPPSPPWGDPPVSPSAPSGAAPSPQPPGGPPWDDPPISPSSAPEAPPPREDP